MSVDAQRLEELSRAALVNGTEEEALKLLTPAAARADDARLWQFAGLLQRSLDHHAEAIGSFTAAARLAPGDASIAHGHARVALEAGLDAVPLFETAVRLAPGDAEVFIGLTAAKFAAGRGLEAASDLEVVLRRSPLWTAGHEQLAQLRSMLGERERFTESLEHALASHPNDPTLWIALFDLAIRASDFAALAEATSLATASAVPERVLKKYQAIAAAESGKADRADGAFAVLSTDDLAALAVWHVRHLIRTGRITEAVKLIDRNLRGDRAAQFWPYAQIAWRLADDPRVDWLESGGQLITTFDVANGATLDGLASVLRSIHVASGEYLDQSVRGGTQTDGPLLSRIDPEIQSLREAIVSAVHAYVAKLPAHDPTHPSLRQPRDRRVRFAGSWSVRLRGAGFHRSHVHPQGWISSACYISLPGLAKVDAPAGSLRLGQPPAELNSGAMPTRLIEPKLGQLVLFPSWMWHETLPFESGERLTVAFDVKPPI